MTTRPRARRAHRTGCLALLSMSALLTGHALAAPSSAPASQPTSAKPRRLLVMDLQAAGVPASAASTTTQLLAAQLAQRADLQVSTIADVKGAISLEQAQQLVGCKEDAACLSGLQRLTQADVALKGTLGLVGKKWVLTLTLLDVKLARPLGNASETLDGADAIAPALPGLLDKLFGTSAGGAGARFSLPAGKALSFAVMDLEATGLSNNLAVNLTQVLGSEVKRIEGSKVISRDDIKAMLQLEQTKQLLACGDTSCMAELGGALGVDRLIVGHVGKLEASYVISLRLIDPARAIVENRVTESYRGSEDQLLGAVRHAGRTLLGVGRDATGTLAVGSSEEQAEIFVDGTSKGVLPLAPITGIGAGRHSVRVAKGGFYDQQSELYVNPAEATVLWAQLEQRPTPWYQTWWFWTLSGGAVLAATTAVVVVLALPGNVPDTAVGTAVLRGAP